MYKTFRGVNVFWYMLFAVSSCIIYKGRATYGDVLGMNFLDTKITWKSQILKTLKFKKINIVQKNLLKPHSMCTLVSFISKSRLT